MAPGKSELYMDNELILSHVPESTPLQFISSGYDEATREVIIKVVNAEGKSYPARIKLEGMEVESTGKVISLASGSDMDENSLKNLKRSIRKRANIMALERVLTITSRHSRIRFYG